MLNGSTASALATVRLARDDRAFEENDADVEVVQPGGNVIGTRTMHNQRAASPAHS